MTNLKILIIDDDPTTCTLLATTLELEGYQTASVHLIADDDVIAPLSQHQPDILFLDFYLGSQETLPYLTTIRQNTVWKRLPILMTSAIDHTAECLAAGATDFIIKPFNWDDMTQKIHAIRDQIVHSAKV
jgi:two-component system, sensor histidine kinase and response regulator